MTILQAIVLGVVQGITEFLPISSSGHLIAFPRLFGWDQQGADFDVIIHVATLFAIVWALRKEVFVIGQRMWSDKVYMQLAAKLLIATIPVGLFGLVIASSFLDDVRNVSVVAGSLIVWGVVLWIADRYAERVRGAVKNVEKVSWRQALFIGVMQAIALIPGTSRSGVTMTAGLFANMERKTAAKFSFLLAIPAIAGAGLLVGIDALQEGFSASASVLVAGFISAFVSGVFAIQFLLRFLEKADFRWFAWYRILLGILLLVFFVV